MRRLAAVTLLALAACAPKPETPEQMAARMRAESDSARTAIEAFEARYSRFWAEGQADSVAALFTEDGVLMDPNAPAITGRAAIRASTAELMGYGTGRRTGTTTRVDANGPLAVAQGVYVAEFTPGPRTPPAMAVGFPDTGKYVAAFRKVNGTWLAFALIHNTSRGVSLAKRR